MALWKRVALWLLGSAMVLAGAVVVLLMVGTALSIGFPALMDDAVPGGPDFAFGPVGAVIAALAVAGGMLSYGGLSVIGHSVPKRAPVRRSLDR